MVTLSGNASFLRPILGVSGTFFLCLASARVHVTNQPTILRFRKAI